MNPGQQPLSMRESALGMHEMLLCLMDVGFTRSEAIYLIASMFGTAQVH